MSKTYQWLVARGRVGIWSDSTHVHLELDPEGSAYCVLTAQDATEIGGIIAENAQDIWQLSDKLTQAPSNIEGDVQQACTLRVGTHALQLLVHDSAPMIALVSDASSPLALNVTDAVSLVQILRYMSDTVAKRDKPD